MEKIGIAYAQGCYFGKPIRRTEIGFNEAYIAVEANLLNRKSFSLPFWQ